MAMSRRRRLSKRQKRRSLKRKNVKSRKVMRGGDLDPDPLIGVKVGDTVTVGVTEYPRHPVPPIDKTFDCTVTNVQSSLESQTPKIVTLNQPTDSNFKFAKRIKQLQFRIEPYEYSDTFDIQLNKLGKSYSFRTYTEGNEPTTYTQAFMKNAVSVVPDRGEQRWIGSVSIKS